MLYKKYPFNHILIENINRLGFKRPTDIQFKCIPSILKGEDVLAVAQTGTGKTAAYLIPLIEKIYTNNLDRKGLQTPSCLILVPTHELAEQVAELAIALSEGLNIKVAAIYGGKNQEDQIQKLKGNNGIVVATPGRLFDLEHQGYLKLSEIKYLVLDEADKMLFHQFLKDIQDIILKINKQRQTLFFSATLNKVIKKIAYQIIKQKAIRIQLSPKNPVSNNVTHLYALIKMDDKRFFLERVLQENEDEKTIIFVRTKVRAERVCNAMERAGIKTVTLHSDKTQTERTAIIEAFENKENNILIATDLAARGLDFKNIGLVINYDIPDQAENYIHRIGRSGRGKSKGLAYSFLADEEMPYWNAVCAYLGYEPNLIKIKDNEYDDTLSYSNQITPKLSDVMDIIADDDLFKAQKEMKKRKK